MQISIQPAQAWPNTTTLTIVPDVGRYAKVAFDGDNAGTYSFLVVPEGGWDDGVVSQAILTWLGMTAQ